VTGAFLYLTGCSVRNALRARAARLREPRYAVGFLIGLGYLAMVFGRSLLRMSSRATTQVPTHVATLLAGHSGAFEIVGAVALVSIAAIAWLLPPGARPPLAFTRSEVQWLFPAPVARAQLLHYKILRSQGMAAISSLIVTLLVHLGDLGGAWMSFVGIWLVIVTIDLHLMGVALRRQSLIDHGRHGWRHQVIPLAVILTVVAIIAEAVRANWSTLSASHLTLSLLDEIDAIGRTSPLHEVLLPLVSLVRLPLSATPAAFLAALPIAAAVVVANYVWVVRSDAAFEESAATFAERLAEMRERTTAPMTAARVRAQPFHLQPTGRPEVAFLWKNLIMVGRYANVAFLARMAIAIVAVAAVATSSGHAPQQFIARVCVFGAGLVTLFGAQWARSDLRRDLAHLATLRTWPVSGPAIVRGEVLGTAAVLSAAVWLLVLGAVACGPDAFAASPLLAARRLSLAAGAMIVAPAIILTQIVACNAVAAIFPAWSSTVTSRARGIDVAGQRVLMMGGVLLTLAVALIPALLAAGVAGIGLRFLFGVPPVVVPALVAAAVLVIENAVASEMIGRALDRTDLASLPPAS
jgi:hypothetical protein